MGVFIKGFKMINEYLFKDYHVHIDKSGMGITQDIEPHLNWAKHQRELSRANKFSKKDTGFKPYCNVPDSVALDIMTKYGINLHDANIQQAEMRKFKQIIKQDYPYLMYY